MKPHTKLELGRTTSSIQEARKHLENALANGWDYLFADDERNRKIQTIEAGLSTIERLLTEVIEEERK